MRGWIIVLTGVSVMFWNLENFFDFRNGNSSKHRFYSKCEAVCKEIFRIEDRYGELPDLIGLAEVENEFVINQLLRSTLLCKAGYSLIHYDSPDHRGIDCALLYRSSSLELLDSKPCHIYDSSGTVLNTRDILLASFKASDGKRIDILVNHHPSQIGGKNLPRMLAKSRMQSICDSLSVYGGTIISIGDFNEGPGWQCHGLRDLSEPGQASIRYNGEWELIDRCYVSESSSARMEVVADPALTVHDNVHGGEKPRRTSQGPRYLGGVSDHYPIMVFLE